VWKSAISHFSELLRHRVPSFKTTGACARVCVCVCVCVRVRVRVRVHVRMCAYLGTGAPQTGEWLAWHSLQQWHQAHQHAGQRHARTHPPTHLSLVRHEQARGWGVGGRPAREQPTGAERSVEEHARDARVHLCACVRA
jgi:hypothetical protein